MLVKPGYRFQRDFYTRESYPPWGGWDDLAKQHFATTPLVSMDVKSMAFITLFGYNPEMVA